MLYSIKVTLLCLFDIPEVNMGTIKALIVGVSNYVRNSLPLCYNDIFAIENAIISGLNAKPENLLICGDNKTVTVNDFIKAFHLIIQQIDIDDTFILYFSGHGAEKNGDNYFVFSDDALPVKSIVELVGDVHCTNKLVIIDSCHSGSDNLLSVSKIDINETANQFVGRGCAVMASCNLDEKSGFHPTSGLSLYTHIICDAFMTKSLIRKGKKSLEDIRKYVDICASVANKNRANPQHNAFRSNIIGTVYFDVADYNPYKSQKIYKETDKYIIYDVSPVHSNVKRISIKVLLRFPCSVEEIADIANEIKNDAIHYDVFTTQVSEERFKGRPNNIIFGYYGYDENDMINGNFAYRSTWVDDLQDKSYWYKQCNNSYVISDVKIDKVEYYDFMKKYVADNTSDDNSLIEATRECMYKMINAAEKFIYQFREFTNNTISEQELIDNVSQINTQINELFLLHSDLPIASNKLHDWQLAYSQLAGTIHDFSLYYSKKHLNKRDSKNRVEVTELTIKRYNEDLEKLKTVDKDFVI